MSPTFARYMSAWICVLAQLDQAAQKLGQAQKALEGAKPGEAQPGQAEAKQALQQALQTLQAAQEQAKGMGMGGNRSRMPKGQTPALGNSAAHRSPGDVNAGGRTMRRRPLRSSNPGTWTAPLSHGARSEVLLLFAAHGPV